MRDLWPFAFDEPLVRFGYPTRERLRGFGNGDADAATADQGRGTPNGFSRFTAVFVKTWCSPGASG